MKARFFNEDMRLSQIRPLWLLLDTFSKYLVCFFKGHDEKMGERYNYEPDWCARCNVTWPQDCKTIHDYLQAMYSWVVERDWEWFDRLNHWLFEHFNMPGWWSY